MAKPGALEVIERHKHLQDHMSILHLTLAITNLSIFKISKGNCPTQFTSKVMSITIKSNANTMLKATVDGHSCQASNILTGIFTSIYH